MTTQGTRPEDPGPTDPRDDERPQPSWSGSSTRDRIHKDVVDALEKATVMRSESGRLLLIDLVERRLGQGLQVRSHSLARAHLVEIVNASATIPGREGLAVIVDAMEELEPGSKQTLTLQHLLEEWHAVGYFSDEGWLDLRHALVGVVLPDLSGICRIVTDSRIQSLPSRCADVWQVFVHLACMNAHPAGDALPPSMAFLEYVATHGSLGQEVVQRIRDWNRRWATDWKLTTALEATRWRPQQVPSDVLPTCYLVIQLSPYGIEPDHYHLTYWRQTDSYRWLPQPGEQRLVHRDDLEREVETVVKATEVAWATIPRAVTLEFVLPWELLNMPVEWWRTESESANPLPLIVKYPIVVRSLERQRSPHWHRVWRQRWRKLKAEPAGARTFHCRPGDLASLDGALNGDEQIVALVPNEPPHPERNVGWQEVEIALRSGLPVLIWHRKDCSTEEFKGAVSDLVADGGMLSLPARVRRLRLEALRQDPTQRGDHVARHLVVLWDDPDRQLDEPPPFLPLAEGRRA